MSKKQSYLPKTLVTASAVKALAKALHKGYRPERRPLDLSSDYLRAKYAKQVAEQCVAMLGYSQVDATVVALVYRELFGTSKYAALAAAEQIL